MIHGEHESSTTTNSPAAPSLDDTEEPGTSSSLGAAQERAEAEEVRTSEDGPTTVEPAPRPQRTARKRKSNAFDYQQALLTEQRLLRESFEAAHAREMEMRERHLKVQEKLANCIVRFLGPPE